MDAPASKEKVVPRAPKPTTPVSWLRSPVGQDATRSAAVVSVAMVASFFSAWLLEDLAGLQTGIVVLAVALSVIGGRVLRQRDWRSRALGAFVLLLAAPLACETSGLMGRHPPAGDTLFAFSIAAAVWARRFGPRAAEVGTLVTVPFVATLVAAAPPGAGMSYDAWSAVTAAVAAGWALAALLVAERTGLLPRQEGSSPSPALSTPSSTRRALPPSTRMALQMGAGLGAAFAFGHWLWPAHWPWAVITAYVVASGNRGRADVVHKGWLRVLGTAAGAGSGTVLIGALPAGSHWTVVVVLAVLGIATWLRPASYAYWAVAVTAVMALFYGYYGQRSAGLLLTRLEGIAVGGAIAVVAATVIVPIRSTDVLRRRVADSLAAFTDYLSAAGRRDLADVQAQGARVRATVQRLDEIAPAFFAHPRLFPRTDDGPVAAVLAVRACGALIADLTARAVADPGLLGDRTIAQNLATAQAMVVTARRGMTSTTSSANPTPTARDRHSCDSTPSQSSPTPSKLSQ